MFDPTLSDRYWLLMLETKLVTNIGYINVGDGYWRRLMLVTTKRYKWPFWSVGDGFIFKSSTWLKRSTTLWFVTNIFKLSPLYSHQHHVTNNRRQTWVYLLIPWIEWVLWIRTDSKAIHWKYFQIELPGVSIYFCLLLKYLRLSWCKHLKKCHHYHWNHHFRTIFQKLKLEFKILNVSLKKITFSK